MRIGPESCVRKLGPQRVASMGLAMKRAVRTYTLESSMKIKTNVHAGKGGSASGGGGGGSGGGHNSSQANNTVGLYIPPVSRCVGI
jgi:hypothetical protein